MPRYLTITKRRMGPRRMNIENWLPYLGLEGMK